MSLVKQHTMLVKVNPMRIKAVMVSPLWFKSCRAIRADPLRIGILELDLVKTLNSLM